MELTTVAIDKPDEIKFILGQSHFINSVEDMHEVLPQNGPGIKSGVAFCEVSGAMPGRWSGTDGAMVELAKRTALALSAGHRVIYYGYFPVSMLNAIKMAREVCRIFRASAEPVEVVIAETAQGRGIQRVIDGGTSKVSKTRRHDLAQRLAVQAW